MNSKTKCRLQVSIYRKSSQQDQKKKGNLAPQAKNHYKRSKEVATLRLQWKKKDREGFLVKTLRSLF